MTEYGGKELRMFSNGWHLNERRLWKSSNQKFRIANPLRQKII